MSLLPIVRCTLIATMVFCVGYSARCQMFIRLSGGMNFPQGDFADTEVETDGDGMAMTGGSFDLSFGLPVYKNFGVIASARYQGNKFDPKPLADYTGGSVHADAWESMAFFAGAFYDFNVRSKFLITVYAQGGLLRTRFPTARLSSQYPASTARRRLRSVQTLRQQVRAWLVFSSSAASRKPFGLA